MTKPIRIRLTKATGSWPKGAELGVASKAVADRKYPDHVVVAYTDTSEYVAPPEPKVAETKTETKGDKP